VVSGQNNHDWEWTSTSLVSMLAKSGKFEASLTLDPSRELASPTGLARYQAVVLDYNGPRWGEKAETNFLSAVQDGLGVVVVHAANNAFTDWDEYCEMVALLWKPGTTGHGAFHPFGIEMTDRGHPITATLPDFRGHPDELYHRLVNFAATDYRLLASAWSDPEKGGSGQSEPMLLVKQRGKGRIIHTPLGHVWRGQEKTRASHTDPQFQNLIIRSTEWAATGSVTDGLAHPNQLSPRDRRAGWRLLFDGETSTGWTGRGKDAFPGSGWSVVNGCLRHAAGGGGGDIVSSGLYEDFELAFEWKVAAGANSGVMIRVEPGGRRAGPEYQILDDSLHRDGSDPKTSAAGVYGLYAGEGKRLGIPGTFNHGRIVVRGNELEHWLNGTRVLACTIGSGDWNQRLARSKFKDRPGYGAPAPGRILLQDHHDEVWYRSIRIRDLKNLPGEEVTLFDGQSLDGWRVLGDAVYTAEGGAIHGRTGGGAQSFLTTERSFSDFLLEVDLLVEGTGNSGIQIRSHDNGKGRLVGYQIEIDPSPRSWSGGLYDELRRGWLQDLSDNPAGRAAFIPGEWNRYRIECIGESIRAWVNGVPTVDFVDSMDSEGVFGLQVHSGQDTRVRWKNFRLRDLSRD